MIITTTTPKGKEFSYSFGGEKISITSQNGFTHQYKFDSLTHLLDWLKKEKRGEWVRLGSKGEEETPIEGTVEEWARSEQNPTKGFYGVTSGRRGRFASYIPSILRYEGKVEIEKQGGSFYVRAIM